MLTNLEQQLFSQSLELWGMDSQILMLAEEASELSVATLHLLRKIKDKKSSIENFAEEIADVEFLIAEMKFYFPELEPKIKRIRIEKSRKLDLLIQNAEARKK